jgi:glycosyltransferase involved in cell wall biosynthesis
VGNEPLIYLAERRNDSSGGRGIAAKRALVAQKVYGEPQTKATPLQVSISIVLPMFNEGEVVEKTLIEVTRNLERNFLDFEVIVVDDASTDDCAERVERWAERDSRVTLIRMSRNERFGGALRRGLEAARKDWIFYTDFDLPIDLDCLPGIWKELQEVDMVTGYSPEVPKNLGWDAKLLSVGYNRMVHAAFGLPLRDVNFGFKAMRKAVRDELHLVSRSPFVDAEMFIQARRKGFTIREVPVPFLRRQAGVSRIRRLDVILWSMMDMARVRLRPNARRVEKAGERVSARE